MHQRSRLGRDMAELLRRIRAIHVHNQRVIRRPALDPENHFDRLCVQRVRAEPVDRFGGKGHELAVPDQVRGHADGLVRRGADPGMHQAPISLSFSA